MSAYRVNVLAHSAQGRPADMSPPRTTARGRESCNELVTLALQAPRTVLAEFNTHRMVARNVESSRAIPIEKRIKMAREAPYIPGATPDGLPLMGNNPGMTATTPLSADQLELGQIVYRNAANDSAHRAERLLVHGWHKQDANRLLEPFSWTRIVATATLGNWNHFLWLRTDDDVYPPFRFLARAIAVALSRSTPRVLGDEEWHLPYITDADREAARNTAENRWGSTLIEKARFGKHPDPFRGPREVTGLRGRLDDLLLLRWSVARCARISYYNFGGGRTWEEDEKLFDKLFPAHSLSEPRQPKPHPSPAEHQARPELEYQDARNRGGNLGPYWVQYRKLMLNEYRPDYFPSPELRESWNVPDETFDPLT